MLLGEVKDARAVRAAVEVAVLVSILGWCTAHEVTRDDETLWLAGYGDHGLTLGGPGCPLVRESAVIELAAALGVSTTSGADQVAVALELRYRLPRLWERVSTGACPVWRARLVAEKTVALCEDGAEEVDTHVAAFAHSISYAQLDRLVEEALIRWDPHAAAEKRKAAADGRRCDIRLADHDDGVVHVQAGLDLADAVALESAVVTGPGRSPRTDRPSRSTCAAPKRWAPWPRASRPSPKQRGSRGHPGGTCTCGPTSPPAS